MEHFRYKTTQCESTSATASWINTEFCWYMSKSKFPHRSKMLGCDGFFLGGGIVPPNLTDKFNALV